MPFNSETLHAYPTLPGVYMMKNKEGDILYIGKAKDLRQRLKNYFFSSQDPREMIPYLVAQVETIETIVTFNEKEALILEGNLIKQYQPRYNILLKDDKSFISLMINDKHDWPQLKLVRYRGARPQEGIYFGPYPSAYAARKTLEVLQKVFPLRQCSDGELVRRKRPCLLYEMKRCLAPCVNKCTPSDYRAVVKKTEGFLKGKDDTLLKQLKEEIDAASSALDFEHAGALYQLYQQAKEVFDHHQFAVQLNVADCDVFGYVEKGPKALGVILQFRNGKLSCSRSDFFPFVVEDKEVQLADYIRQYYTTTTPPATLILPFLPAGEQLLLEVIKEHHHLSVEWSIPQKGNKKLLLNMAEKNAQALFEMQLKTALDSETLLADLEKTLQLNRLPLIIECFDTSNLANLNAVAAMCVAKEGRIDKKAMKLFKIKHATQGDDYTAMKEVITRRYERALRDGDLPDLIVIDGGKGQLNIVKNIFQELNIVGVDIVALTKEEGRHDKGMRKERIFLENSNEPLELSIRSPLLFFLQTLRDEAHRIAIGYQRKVQRKHTLSSGLDAIEGIGATKKRNLLIRFGSLSGIKEASDEEILEVKGIGRKDLLKLREYFNQST